MMLKNTEEMGVADDFGSIMADDDEEGSDVESLDVIGYSVGLHTHLSHLPVSESDSRIDGAGR